MPRDMASLMSQPSQATPPSADMAKQQGPDSTQAGSLQQLMQDNPGASMEQGAQGQPSPNYHMTVAALKHMRMFAQGWEGLLKLDEIGKADIKGPFIEMMAKQMGEGLVSLPQTLQMMKAFPEDPLQQRQFVEQHYAKDRQAIVMLSAQFAQAFPGMSRPPPKPREGMDHIGMMTNLAKHYKQFARKK